LLGEVRGGGRNDVDVGGWGRYFVDYIERPRKKKRSLKFFFGASYLLEKASKTKKAAGPSWGSTISWSKRFH